MFSQDYALGLHTTYISSLQFKVIKQNNFWVVVCKNFFFFIFCQKSAERKSVKKYFLIFYFVGLNYGFTPNKLTYFVLEYGEFKHVFRGSRFCIYSKLIP